MFKNYFFTTFRVLRRQKLFSLINVTGLAIGMVCAILVFLYIRYEFSYDKYNQNSERLFRVVGDLSRTEISPESAKTAPPMAPVLVEEIPAIVEACRIVPGAPSTLVQYEDKRFHEAGLGYVDPAILRMFSFFFIEGNSLTALDVPYTVVISQTMAKKYFKDERPIGKRLIIDNENEYEITGVFADMPRNSHFRFDFMVPFNSMEKAWGRMYNCWWCKMTYTYVLLPENFPPSEVEQQFPGFLENHIGPQDETGISLRLQPLSDIHLYSELQFEIEPGGNITYLYILATMGLAVLLLACVNYTNLTTAIYAQRTKEVGVRKVIGASAKQLKIQFLGESVMITLIALPIALYLADLCLPELNDLLGVSLGFEFFDAWTVLLVLTALSALVGLFSGSYPAIFLSRFQPVKVLQGSLGLGARSSRFRNALVVLQFSISILFIIATATIFKQLDFIRNKNLGFDKEHVVTIPIPDKALNDQFEAFKNELLKNTSVINVSRALHIPSERMWDLDVWPGDAKESRKHKMKVEVVDYDYFKTLRIETKEGRTFSRDFPSDAKEGFVLNETAVKTLGWENTIGRKFGVSMGNRHGNVIGVVRDFHFEALHHKIESAVFYILEWYNHGLIRISPDNIPETIAFLQTTWQIFLPYHPFEYAFLDAQFDALYKKEQKSGEIFNVFSALTVFIACLGLFGLAAFAAERRIKEAGIRKVFGARVWNITGMISIEFIKLVVLANIIAWPIAYIGLNKWLRDFAYRVDIDLWLFVFAGLAALAIAMVAVSFHALKVALSNPVKVLRYE